MSKIVVTSFLSTDGVMEAPEKWSFPYWNDTIERFKDDELRASEAQLLGRGTYEIFAAAWPSRSGFYADRLNQSHKYVVSTSLADVAWNNTQVLAGAGGLRDDVARLKSRHAGDILVHGSHSLVQALAQRDLIDEYHLLVYPLVLGQGRRLFASTAQARLELVRIAEMGFGVVLMVYRRPAP